MSDAEIGASARRALADMDPHEAARVAYQAMRENDLPRAVDVIRLGGPALVVIKVPEGRITLNGGEETSCAALAKLIASPVSRIPGVTVMVVPLAWSVEVHAVPAGHEALVCRSGHPLAGGVDHCGQVWCPPCGAHMTPHEA